MSCQGAEDGRIEVYSSCAWKYGRSREALHGLLQTQWRKGVDFCDASVLPKGSFRWMEEDLEFARAMKERISGCDVVLAFAGACPADEMWVELELSFAESLGKPVVAIAPYQKVSRPVQTSALAKLPVTPWRGDAVRRAIWNALSNDKRHAFVDRMYGQSQDVKQLRSAVFTRRVETMLDTHRQPAGPDGRRRKLPALARHATARQQMTGQLLLGAAELTAAREAAAQAPGDGRPALLDALRSPRRRRAYARALKRTVAPARPAAVSRSRCVRRFTEAAHVMMADERYRRIAEVQRQAAFTGEPAASAPRPSQALAGLLRNLAYRSTDREEERAVRA